MKLIVHIGIGKTGTSSLQHFLWINKDVLKKYGILYPNVGVQDGAHHLMAKTFLENINNKNKLFVDLVNEIKRNHYNTILISSEGFSYLSSKHIRLFWETFSPIVEEFCVITYIRRQDVWYESMYKQYIKDSNIRYRNAFYFFNSSLDHISNFYKLIKRWIDYHKPVKYIVKIYEPRKFYKENVIHDFLNILNLNISFYDFKLHPDRVQINPSLTHISALILRLLNDKYDFNIDIHNKLVEFLFDIDKKHRHPLKTFFTLDERLQFLEKYRESNEKLFREFFGSENKFVLSEEEIEFYKQQDEILKDKKRLEKDIKERYEQVIEFLKQIEPNFEKYKRDRFVRVFDGVIIEDNEVYGSIDVMNKEFIAGWILDMKEKKPTEIILTINDMPVLTRLANKSRKDVSDRTGIGINTGFQIYWHEISLPDSIKSLPLNTVCDVKIIHKRTGKVLQGNYIKVTLKDLMEITQSFTNWEIEYYIDDSLRNIIELFRIDTLYVNALKHNTLIIGGILVLKKELNFKDYKLILRQNNEDKIMEFGISSPFVAKKFPKNPNARYARFKIEGVREFKEAEVILIHNDDKGYNLAVIRKF